MLTRFDDYPIHQTPEPIARPATTDRNAYDRIFLNGYSDDGEFYFAAGLALYPNRGIMDCAFSVVRDGVQHAFFASRRAPDEPSDTRVGPLAVEVVEPMRSLRLTLGPNDTGIECALTFTARTACIEEGRQIMRRDGRAFMDATRFAQFGRWEGSIVAGGTRIPIEPGRVYGTKDRSWGLRPVGEPEAGGAPSAETPHIFFMWAPIHWPDRCTHFIVFDDEHGEQWHADAMIAPAYEDPSRIPGVVDPATEVMERLEHRLVYESGTRRARSAELALISADGVRHEISLEPLLRFQMKGLGYTHLTWGHGRWQGEDVVAGETWKLDELDPMAIDNQHIQQVVRARMGDREGVGVLEQLAYGRHTRYGFKEFLDPAK